MGYQALLFCPDEKTARSVTQVLGELEFSVEPCSETFAAVKKLMGQHFDAIVVDCDNEQNATLLFKSARNSASNQTSLAVAVVEGQAGVAKAFRLGANLVLTKPINVEQAKGTLRVARGLLRKGESTKPVATGATVPAPAKPSAPVSTAKPIMPVRPAPSPDPAAPAATASSAPVVADQEVPAGKSLETAPAEPRATFPAARTIPATLEEARAALHSKTSASASRGSGAASAPAPARDILEMPPLEVLPSVSTPEEDDILEGPGTESSRAATESAKDVPPPSFTLGGSASEKSSGPAKKIVMGLVAAVIVAVGVYTGWTHFAGHNSQAVSNPAPVSKASTTQPAPLPNSQPAAAPVPAVEAPAPSSVAQDQEATPDNSASAVSKKHATSVSPSAGKATPEDQPAAEEEPAAAPLVVKGGSVQPRHAAPAAADAPAPSVIGMAGTDTSGPLPDLGGSATAQPVLSRLSVSQGVSQGLLIKKVAPVYPANALHMHIEGAVNLLATISAEGNITDVKVLNGDPQLTRAASDAVKQWKYKPYLLNGEPVEIQTQVTINFRLPH
jgi:TonB family protein